MSRAAGIQVKSEDYVIQLWLSNEKQIKIKYKSNDNPMVI
jgi:hypothetical protein